MPVISIIIPVLNEAEFISDTIQKIFNNALDPGKIEVIVVDNGSVDRTVELASALNATVIEAPQLKGRKYAVLNRGASAAKGEILLFLDADTLLPHHYDSHIKKGLKKKGVVGGAFEFSFDKKRPDLLLITLVNRIRYRIRKRYYGDQGIFVMRSAFEKAGGFPPKRLLEAAYLCNNLQLIGKLTLISKKVITSSRRFTEGGVFKVFVQDIKIWLLDLLGREVDKHGDVYWAVNDKK